MISVFVNCGICAHVENRPNLARDTLWPLIFSESDRTPDMDEESGRGDRKFKKEKKHKKHKKRANDVEEDPVDSERGPDPQQQAKDRYNQSVPTKDIEQKQVINWEDINYPPVLRLFHYK
jgi:hypothetical protein